MNEAISTTPTLPATRTRGWVRWVLMFVIFVSGFALGAYAAGIVIRSAVIESIKTPEIVPPRIAARLRRLLDLTDEQTEQVTAILEERRLAIQSIRREFQPQIEAELDQAQTGIAAVLSDEQRGHWQRHFTEMRALWMPPVPK
jgi:hypothetical protein